VADIADAQLHQIASAQLAVDAQVEQRQFAAPVLHLQVRPDRPDFPGLERGLLPDELALVPRLAMNGIACGTHDGLPSSKGPCRMRSVAACAPAWSSSSAWRLTLHVSFGANGRTHGPGQMRPLADDR